MNYIIIIGYIINLLILSFYFMHMFQLNSYFLKKHAHWMKKNIKKIIIQIILIIIPTIFALFNNMVCNVLAIIFLLISVIYNFPKGKSKVKFNITSRVKRMFITEALLIAIAMLIDFKNYIILKLALLNIISSFMCVIANIINYPIESLIRKYYINSAKQILKGMPNLTIIGVTGSFGKTSLKNFLATALEKKYEVLTTPKNYNTTMGVVRTIRENLRPTHQIFICEMGATKLNDIKEICDLVHPKYGAITSIGPQHLESFKTIENVIKTKFELADSVKDSDGIMFLNYDNRYIAKENRNQKIVKYGTNNDGLDYNAYDIKSSSIGSTFKMKDKRTGEEVEFKTKLIGEHNVVNIVGAIAISNSLGISLRDLAVQVNKIKSVEHRLQLIVKNGINIIDDSYNSNPVSSKSALDSLSSFDGSRILVTPGLIELGAKENEYNFELGKYAAKKCDYIFLVNSKQSKYIYDGIISENFDKSKIYNVSSPGEAVQKVLSLNLSSPVTVLLENDLPDNYNV